MTPDYWNLVGEPSGDANGDGVVVYVRPQLAADIGESRWPCRCHPGDCSAHEVEEEPDKKASLSPNPEWYWDPV